MNKALITGGAQGNVTWLRADGWRVAVFDLDTRALDGLGLADRGLMLLPVDVAD